MNKHIQFSGPLARTLFALLIGGGLYGFFGPNRLMGCDGAAADDWVSRNLLCPAFSALIIMSAITLWAVGALWVFSLISDKGQK